MAHERILIVEDEKITAMMISHQIQNLGYEPLGPVATGEEAVEKVCDFCPDAILMDIVLKGQMDGVQAANIIQSKYSCPIIYVTAHSDQSTLDRAKLKKPFGYIIKPINERELHIAIEVALYNYEMEERLKESMEWFRTTLNSIDEAIIALDTRGKVTFMNAVARAFLGWPEADALGTSALEVFNVIDENSASYTGIEPGKGDRCVSIRTREKKVVPVVYRSAPIVNGTEDVMGVVIIFREAPRDQPPCPKNDSDLEARKIGEACR
jgi:PAS domain S-box-containing protein